MNITDKKIRRMYRKKAEQLASERGYIEIKKQVKTLLIIAAVEFCGIIGLIIARFL